MKNKIFHFLPLMIISISICFNCVQAFSIFGKKKERLGIIDNLGGDFKLIGPDETEISTKDFRGKVLLINFGYTFCPDVCPMTLSHLNQVMIELGEESEGLQVLFISIDPDRDTPEKLKNYVPYFNSTFIGLTGSKNDISEVANKYGIFFFKQEVESEAGYFMAHMEGVFLVDQKGRLRGRYKTNKGLKKLLSDIKWILEYE